nr:hypothetical protein [Tanacetum cinerariifolium]
SLMRVSGHRKVEHELTTNLQIHFYHVVCFENLWLKKTKKRTKIGSKPDKNGKQYYDNSTNYGLFVNDNDDQEIFHDAIESASENFIENHIDSQKNYDKSEVDHNDFEEKEQLVDKLIRKFNQKIAKCQKRIETAYQQSKDLENQNKDLQEKYDILINQVNIFEEQNNEFNEQIKVLNEKNVDLLAQTEVLQDQLKVKYVVIDTHTECQAQYAKLEEERYEYMIRYFALFNNDKQHRKKIDEQEILFDKMSLQLVKMNNNVLRLQEKILEKNKNFRIGRLEWSRHVTIVHQTKDLHTADYTQLYDFLKYNKKEVDELKAERLAKTQDPLALMATSNNPYNFPVPHQDQPSFNQNYMQQPIPNLDDIIDPTTAMNMALALMAKEFKLNYSTPTNNNQRNSSNLRNRQVAQPGINMGQDRQMQMVGGNGNQNQIGNGNLVAARTEGNTAGHNGNQIRCYNCRGVGYFARNCTVKPRRRDVAYLQTQLLIAQKEEAGIQLQAKEFDLMAAVVDLDEIKEVNANCILMADIQQSSTSGTQSNKAPIYDSDGPAEGHDYEYCYDNEIFNMFTQEE